MLLSGYWVKLVDKKSYLSGTAAQLEIMRFMSPALLTGGTAGSTIKGVALGVECFVSYFKFLLKRQFFPSYLFCRQAM